MSTSWSRQIGSLVGGTLAGPAGAIIGGIATSILGEAIEIDDPIRDAIGGVIGEEAGGLLGHLSPSNAQQINHDLQTAFRDAFCEAVYDIGGESCFAQVWKKAPRDVPLEVVYPKSGAPHLWARKDPLADQLCDCLHQMEQAVDELLPLEPPADNLAANVERYLSTDTPQALADEFFTQILAPYLTQFRVLFLEVNNFEPHLRRHLFNRLLIHLGEHLKLRPEAWRAFNRLVLEEIRLRVRALGSGQTHITKQLEQIIAQLSGPHDDGDADRALSSLTDHLADLITATGRVETELNEGFDGLLARVNKQHNEVMTSLAQLIRISESGNKRLIRVAGDVTKSAVIIGDHNTIIQKFTEGLSRLPTNYATRIQNFVHHYLGTPNQPAPFGGRSKELAALDAWLDTPNAPPYALLAAEAGRGKSALLVHWVQSLVARDKATVVFVPVSIRFDTNRATVAFTALAARLGEVYGEPIEWKNLAASQWQGVCESYLRRSPNVGGGSKPLVVILDGLDEAADFTIGASFFPSSRFNLEAAATGGRAMRAVVSARYLAGDVDESGWRRRLGWESEALAVNLPLPPLTQDGLRDVLHQMGNPLDQLATNVDVVGQLYRLSEGDPLLVRLYVEALLPYGEHAAIMTPQQLAAIQPGLSGYFERWWEEQEAQWEAQERDPLGEKEEVLTFFNLCAAALGPLTRNEIAEIAGRPLSSGLRLKRIANELDRFIIGDGKKQGYTFSHPRLSYHFWEEMTRREQREWEERFLNFGRHTLEALNNGTLHPHRPSSYAIQYYGAHLERANASPEAFYALVSEGWMRAWEALEGTHAGFLNDVGRAWQRAEDERDMVMIVKCALCQVSVATLSANIPPELLAQAVKHEFLTPVQGLVIVQQTHNRRQWAQALSLLAPLMPPELLREALAAARAISSEYFRIEALSGLAAHLPKHLLPEALAVARAISDEYYRAKALSGLAAHLPERLLPEALAEALAAARAISDERSRASALSELAAHLPKELLPEALAEALAAAGAISDERSRASALSELAAHLPERLLPSALAAARAISDEHSRASALSGLAAHLPQIMPEALAAARAISNERSRAEVLSGLAAHLPEIVPEALAAVRAISDEHSRAYGLSGLAAHLPERLLPAALTATRAISDEHFRAYALSELAAHLPERLLPAAVAAARAVSDKRYRAYALSGLAAHLPERLLPEALAAANAAARAISDESSRAEALSGLAAHLPEIAPEALAAARAISDERSRAQALSGLATHLPEDLLPEALAAARAISDEDSRAKALSGLVAHLPEITPEALAAVRAISDERSRGEALSGLAAHLPEDLLPEALAAARAISDKGSRGEALSGLAARLPEIVPDALAAARAISSEHSRAQTLSQLALPLAHWAKEEREKAATAWNPTLRHLSARPRPEFLRDLHALMPFTLVLAGEEVEAEAVAEGIFRAILEVCEWWP